jgi:hypothetical protein
MARFVVVVVERRNRVVCGLGQHQLCKSANRSKNETLCEVSTHLGTDFATARSSPSCCHWKMACSSAVDATRSAFRLEDPVSMDEEIVSSAQDNSHCVSCCEDGQEECLIYHSHAPFDDSKASTRKMVT